jgi:7,8-dihydropterin-6-yl-methyl-4-(beta-D-ribofuranosyl)aminobenzene 5'-phosphate synthase
MNVLTVTILAENTTLPGISLTPEDGFSAYVEADGTRTLFDTGQSGIFLENTKKLGISLEPDYIVLSHGHRDHTGGLTALVESPFPKLPVCIGHSHIFYPKIKRGIEFGIPVDQETLSRVCTLTLSKEPVWLSENLLYLGEIPRHHTHETPEEGRFVLIDGNEVPDLLPDDTALVYRSPGGLVVLAGCAHSGICNIIDYAISITGTEEVAAVIGGIHLYSSDKERINATGEFFREKGIKALYLCHCTGSTAIRTFSRTLPVKPCGCGSRISI